MNKAEWKHHFLDSEPQAHIECKELAQKLFELIPEQFIKIIDRTDSTVASKDRMNQLWTIIKSLKETFKQHSDFTPELFLTTKIILCLTLPV